jgi:hypothetical protein
MIEWITTLVGKITLVSIVMIGIGSVPMLLQLLQPIEAKASMQYVTGVYSGPRASIVVSENNIYLTWWDNTTGNNEIYFVKSNDSGKNFSTPINLSNDKGASVDSQIAASHNNVYVTWWDNTTGNWEVLSRASNNNGTVFLDAVMLKGIGRSPMKHLNSPSSNTISVDTIVVAVTGNKEYVTWWDNTTGNWEVFIAKSTNGGKTFVSPIDISNSPNASSVGARIAAQGSNVYITWMDIKPNGQKQIMFRTSNDNGRTFGNPIVVYNGTSSSSDTASSSSPMATRSSKTGIPGMP